MQVLNGCQFICCRNDKEREERGEMLLNLASQYHKAGSLQESIRCTIALMDDLPPVLFGRVSEFVTTLLSEIMDSSNSSYINMTVDLVQLFFKSKMYLPCKVFSKLVSILMNNNKESVAKELVDSAIESNWYHSSDTTPTYIVLPFLISSLEISSLLRHHLMNNFTIRQLDIVCSSSK